MCIKISSLLGAGAGHRLLLSAKNCEAQQRIAQQCRALFSCTCTCISLHNPCTSLHNPCTYLHNHYTYLHNPYTPLHNPCTSLHKCKAFQLCWIGMNIFARFASCANTALLQHLVYSLPSLSQLYFTCLVALYSYLVPPQIVLFSLLQCPSWYVQYVHRQGMPP